ncbi:MAG: glycosyltransferase family 39 protein, partial [Acidobacteria bacterium]|nr:glycosyltransferase family 39 protein [Acidobacteriota bacterium]
MNSQIHASALGDKFSDRPQKAGWVGTLLIVKPADILFVLAAGLYIAARLWDLTEYSLGFDEIFSLAVVRRDWSGLIGIVVYDVVHPPLFYMLLKLWVSIGGESLLWLKLFPVSIAVVAIVPFLLLCRELKLRAGEVNLALVLMAVNGYLIFYAQELRMYSLLLCFTLSSLWLFVRYLNCQSDQKKLLIALFVANLLLIYTQYYGWLVIGVQLVILLFWERRKLLHFLISLAGLILCFSPWAYIVLQ